MGGDSAAESPKGGDGALRARERLRATFEQPRRELGRLSGRAGSLERPQAAKGLSPQKRGGDVQILIEDLLANGVESDGWNAEQGGDKRTRPVAAQETLRAGQ